MGKCIGLVFLSFFLSGCISVLCTRGDSHQAVLFDFGTELGISYVDMGGYPTFLLKDDYVHKLIVDGDKGFLLVWSQKTASCKNDKEMREARKQNKKIPKCDWKPHENYKIMRYQEEKGYEEWSSGQIDKREWELAGIGHSFSQKPDYHYENCRYKLFGGLLMFLQTVDKI